MHSCNLAKSSYGGQAPGHLHAPLQTMSPFNFEPVQVLDIKSEDNPSIDVRDGLLLIQASRAGGRIIISAPLESVLPSASVVQTKITQPSKKPNIVRALRPSKSNNKAMGVNHPLAKMTEESVRELRSMAVDPAYVKSFASRQAMIEDLATVYKIHWTTVYNIINRKSWKHLED